MLIYTLIYCNDNLSICVNNLLGSIDMRNVLTKFEQLPSTRYQYMLLLYLLSNNFWRRTSGVVKITVSVNVLVTENIESFVKVQMLFVVGHLSTALAHWHKTQAQ